jgi:RNA polymerase sigma-70 factor (ECF subfamily)
MRTAEHKLYDLDFKAKLETGCQEAYKILYLDIKKNLSGIIHSITNNPEITHDVIQETFLKVVTKIKDLNNIKKIKYWTMRISINKSIDLVKNNSKTIYSESRLRNVIQKAEVNEFQRDSSTKNLAPRIEDMMKRLPRKQQKVIFLKYFRNLKESMISQELNIPLGTVKSRLYNGKRKLRQLFEREQIFD